MEDIKEVLSLKSQTNYFDERNDQTGQYIRVKNNSKGNRNIKTIETSWWVWFGDIWLDSVVSTRNNTHDFCTALSPTGAEFPPHGLQNPQPVPPNLVVRLFPIPPRTEVGEYNASGRSRVYLFTMTRRDCKDTQSLHNSSLCCCFPKIQLVCCLVQSALMNTLTI